jgi:hypothetical protein
MTEIAEFDPAKHVDRTNEQESFRALLDLSQEARVITIRADGGMGKSSLLKRFRLICQNWVPRIPCALIDLKLIKEPSQFIFKARKRLEPARFQRFDELERSLADDDFTPFGASAASGLATVEEQTGGTLIGRADRVVQFENVPSVEYHETERRPLTAGQQAIAYRVMTQTFFEELAEACSSQAAVFLIDTYEQSSADIQDWLQSTLLRMHVFEERCVGLIVVVAGQRVPDFSLLPRDWHARFVRPFDSLSELELEDVEELFRVSESEPEPAFVQAVFTAMRKKGMNLFAAQQWVQRFKAVG